MPKFQLLTGSLMVAGTVHFADKKSPTPVFVELDEKAGAHLVKAGVLKAVAEPEAPKGEAPKGQAPKGEAPKGGK